MIVTPAMYALLSALSVTVPSGATTFTLTSSWGYTPPVNTQTPASLASSTTSCAASATAGISSSGMKSIAPSSNEIRYRAISRLLSRPPAPAAHATRGRVDPKRALEGIQTALAEEAGLGQVPEHPLGRVLTDFGRAVGRAAAAQPDRIVGATKGQPPARPPVHYRDPPRLDQEAVRRRRRPQAALEAALPHGLARLPQRHDRRAAPDRQHPAEPLLHLVARPLGMLGRVEQVRVDVERDRRAGVAELP